MLVAVVLLVQALRLSDAQKITPPDDVCVQGRSRASSAELTRAFMPEPCVYHLKESLEPNTPFYVLLHNVDTSDSLSCKLNKVQCRSPPCQGLVVYFLREREYQKMEDGLPFFADKGSLTNASKPAQPSYFVHTVISGRYERYYIVLLNRGEQAINVNGQIAFQVSCCC